MQHPEAVWWALVLILAYPAYVLVRRMLGSHWETRGKSYVMGLWIWFTIGWIIVGGLLLVLGCARQ